MSKRWSPTENFELKKLACSSGYIDGGVSVASSSLSSPSLSTRSKRIKLEFSSSPEATGSMDSVATGTSSSSTSKHESTRLIIERDPLKSMMESHIWCPLCKTAVVVSFPTVGIASGCRIQCTNDLCSYVQINKPTPCNITLPEGSGSPLIERTTDYALNALYVTSIIACGDGGKEGERLLGFMGLPNASTMEKRTFPSIEERLSDTIQGLTDTILMENLTKAVDEHYGDKRHEGRFLIDLWRDQVKHPQDDILPRHLFPKLMCSTDMAWQKRSSGNSYDSKSGDAFLVESETRLPITWTVKSKICSVCQRHNPANGPVRHHACRINHEGSAGSMEPMAVLDMVVQAYDEFFVVVEHLITDDDSSMKAKLKWSNEDHMLNNNTNDRPKIINKNGRETYRPNHGQLPRHIPEPIFLADPNHRKKTLKGELYRHLKQRVAQRDGLTRVDIIRVTTNFAYMMRSLNSKPDDQHADCAKAVVEHHFDNHEWCGNFCRRKILSAEQREESTAVYRDKLKDEKLYLFLTNTLARFITPTALAEVSHGSDTQVNESLNNSVTWYAQKNKTYAATSSLGNRICMALGVYSVGYSVYYERLLTEFGIQVTPDTRAYLERQQRTRHWRIVQDKKAESKKKRNTKMHNKLREYTAKENGNAGATYNPGIGMDGGYDEQEPAAAVDNSKVCSACNKPGHLRRTNKKCELYCAPVRNNPTGPRLHTEEQGNRDGDEQALLDDLPFDADKDELDGALPLMDEGNTGSGVDFYEEEIDGRPVVVEYEPNCI